MTVIVTRQNQDGSYDEVGMRNRRLYSHYSTIKGARRYAAQGWTGNIRFEYFNKTYAPKAFLTEIRQRNK